MSAAKELIRQIISENNISSVTGPCSGTVSKTSSRSFWRPKWMHPPGYEKNQKGDLETDKKGMTIPPRHLKASMASSRLMRQGIVTGNSSRSSSQNTSGISPGLRKKCSPCTPMAWAPWIYMTSCMSFTASKCLLKWSARSQTRSCQKQKSGRPPPPEPSLPVCIYGLHPL